MKIDNFLEKIAHVSIHSDKDDINDFGPFYSIRKFPISFNLQVIIAFLNIVPETEYLLKIDVVEDGDELQIDFSDKQLFIVPESSILFLNNGYGQSYSSTTIKLDIQSKGAYKIQFALARADKPDNTLSTFFNYYYFGEI